MSGKWADYLIAKVAFEPGGKRIKEVEIAIYKASKLSLPYKIFPREKLVAELKDGMEFCTILHKDGRWQKDADVKLVVVDGKEYVRADQNKTECDYLNGIPEYNG
ncbi:MAG TPA: hypothetical protein VFA55_04005 [Candidatus Kapabacteria bacterium]|nr:hypothetical protein [Candidatus Kapabacteria bacterium]